MVGTRKTVRRLGMALSMLGMAMAQPATAAARHAGGSRGVSAFDGAWMVSSEGFCTGIGSGQVTIINGRITGPGGAGRVTSDGAVHTITNVDGVTTVGDGYLSGGTGSGIYRQSTGCSGTWTAVKM